MRGRDRDPHPRRRRVCTARADGLHRGRCAASAAGRVHAASIPQRAPRPEPGGEPRRHVTPASPAPAPADMALSCFLGSIHRDSRWLAGCKAAGTGSAPLPDSAALGERPVATAGVHRGTLPAAENVLSLLQARTAAAADSALAGVRSGVGAAVSDMRDDCIRLLAELEVWGEGADRRCEQRQWRRPGGGGGLPVAWPKCIRSLHRTQ
eukprot:363695-Chlamydomonas_euryale.AAC.8